MKTLDGSETILCYPAEVVQSLGPWSGWRSYVDLCHLNGDDILDHLRDRATWLSRTDRLERDRGTVQAVVYGAIWAPKAGEDSVLVYRRHSSGSEGRLHEFLSVGFGGHVDDYDSRQGFPRETFRAAMRREIHEELGVNPIVLESKTHLEIVGLIHDQEDPGVGAHHLGIVFEVSTHLVSVFHNTEHEKAVDIVGWWTPDELAEEYRGKPDQFEPWTRLYIENRIIE